MTNTHHGAQRTFYQVIALIIMTLFIMAVFMAPASAEVYRWVDPSGKIIFSDKPPPAEQADVKVLQIKLPPPAPEPSTATSPLQRVSPQRTEKGGRDYRDVTVIMYVTSWCPYCKKARAYLQSLGVRLVEYDVEQSQARHQEMLLKSGGSKGVPLIDIEGRILKGFNPAAIKAAVEERRS